MRRATTSPSTRRRRPSAAGRSARRYTFSFTTPTVKLLRTDTYRRGGRADAPYVVLLRFNQPVDPADVAAHARPRGSTPHDWERPSISAAAQQRLAAIDHDIVEPLQRQGCGDQRRRASSTGPVTLRLTNDWDKKRFPPARTLVAFETVTRVPSRELGHAHARTRRSSRRPDRRRLAASRTTRSRPSRRSSSGASSAARRAIRTTATLSLLRAQRQGRRVRQVAPRHRHHDGRGQGRAAGPPPAGPDDVVGQRRVSGSLTLEDARLRARSRPRARTSSRLTPA